MINSTGADRLLGVFLSELDERLTAFDADLLALEGQSAPEQRAEIVQRLFRGAHSMKGAAAAVGISEIELLCHKLEDRLSAARDGGAALDRGTVQTFFTSSDKLREIAGRLSNGRGKPTPAPTAPAAAAPAPAPTSAPPPAPAPPPLVRVTAERLDRLVERSGALMIAQHAGEHHVEELRQLAAELGAGAKPAAVARALDRLADAFGAERNALAQVVAALENDIRNARLVPFADACASLERVVRDIAHAAGKRATLRVRGAEIELDRGVADALRTPLAHLIRNAVDHGIESPERRQIAGKSSEGTIEIVASLRGSSIEVTVSDDGGGLDLQRLRERAHERGQAFSDDDPARIVFLPGISTAVTVSTRSGRGVGLDAVQSAVTAMRGHVDVSTTAGIGTRFTLRLPLTLTTLRVVLFRLGEQTFALDEALIRRVQRVTPESLATVEGRPMLRSGEQPVPLLSLHDVLGLGRSAATAAPSFAIIIDARTTPIALAVDALLEDRVVVIRSLGRRLSAAAAVSGASLLGDGTIVPILRNGYVVEQALTAVRARRAAAPLAPEPTTSKRVLLVDDSITTRALERSILEAGGYEVLTAGDGAEAWRLLESHAVDAIVSDVDMPNMNGFELTESVRSSPRLRGVPVVLVTARETEADRQRGIDAGADAYIVKSSFDQRELLETLRQLA